jgi:hypothetical protein
MSIPRDHHFIPEFYLKQWIEAADGKLEQFSNPYDKVVARRLSPDATGYQTDLYAFPELPPEQAQFLESKYFQYADDMGYKALDAHLTGRTAPWPAELVSAWSRFLVGVHLRHPDAMPELRAGAKAVWDSSGGDSQVQYEKIKKASDPPTFDDYIAKTNPLIPYQVQLNMIIKALDNTEVCQHINKMSFAIIDVSKAQFPLLTSDRPVEIHALREHKGIVSMPISPTKLFVAANDESTFEALRHSTADTVVSHINEFVVSRARRYVWACNRSMRPFIEKHFGTAREPLPLFPTLRITNSGEQHFQQT